MRSQRARVLPMFSPIVKSELFFREKVHKEKIDKAHCNTKRQEVDIITKPMKIEKLRELREIVNVVSLETLK